MPMLPACLAYLPRTWLLIIFSASATKSIGMLLCGAFWFTIKMACSYHCELSPLIRITRSFFDMFLHSFIWIFPIKMG